MWRRPRLVTADTKSPAPQPGGNAWWRGAFAPDPATGTEAGPGPTTPRRSAVRRASRLRARCHCLASVASRVTARHVQGWTSLGAPPIPLARGVGSDEGAKRKEKNPDAKRAGEEETGLFDIVNRKDAVRCIGKVPKRHRVSGNVLVSRPSARLGAASLSPAQQALELGPHRGRDVAALERIGDVGREKAHLRSAIEAPAVELQAVERLRPGELDHGVGELNLAAGAALLGREDVEDLRLQEVAAGDDQVRRRGRARGLLHHLREREQAALALADADYAVHVHALGRHLLDRDDVGVGVELARGVDHLRQAAARMLYQHVGEQQREWLV